MVTLDLNSSTSCCLASHEKSTGGGGGHGSKGGAEKSSSTAFRRPRTREVSSRYKSPSPSAPSSPVVNRRFPSPNVDRVAPTTPEAASPRRSQSAERRRPSPTRTPDAKPATPPLDSSLSSKRVVSRGDSLWPSIRSSSSSSAPMRSEHQPQLHPEANVKAFSQSSDHTLKSSANIAHWPMEQRRGTPERKGTPLRRRILDQAENARPQENVRNKADEQRWPGSSSIKNFTGAMSKSVDLTAHRDRQISKAASLSVQGKPAYSVPKLPRPVSFPKNLSQSINEGLTASTLRGSHVESKGRGRDSPGRLSSRTLTHQSNTASRQSIEPNRQSGQEMELASVALTATPKNALDAESISYGSVLPATSSSRTMQGNGTIRVTRGTVVPARFWHDSSGRSRRLSEINKLQPSMFASDVPVLAPEKHGNGQKDIVLVETQREATIPAASSWSFSSTSASNSSTQLSIPPLRIPQTDSPMRSLPSPTRSRGPPLSLSTNNLQSRPGSFTALSLTAADGRKGRKGLTQLEEAHLLRIFHNRLLQWRFINARTESAMNIQKLAAEKSLYSVCTRIAELQVSTRTKRIELQQARQDEKLSFLLSAQGSKLEDWATLQEEHSTALTGAIEALESTTLRIPVTAGVRADVQTVKDVMGSAVNIVNAIESYINILTPKAEKVNFLVVEVAHAAAQGRALLEECRDLLSAAAALEAEDCSLRTHLLQLEQEKERVLGNLMGTANVASNSVLA